MTCFLLFFFFFFFAWLFSFQLRRFRNLFNIFSRLMKKNETIKYLRPDLSETIITQIYHHLILSCLSAYSFNNKSHLHLYNNFIFRIFIKNKKTGSSFFHCFFFSLLIKYRYLFALKIWYQIATEFYAKKFSEKEIS